MNSVPNRLAAALADRYRIDRELGAGGMATVYLADDLRHERKVALKVLRPELAAVIGAERFLKEIKVTANLQHPHILGLIDSGEVDGLLWYAMPFIEGESLRDRLQREKQLPIPDALRIASEVAAALDYAHRHGVIHRDIKPENILLHDGSALVADFGIALAASSAGTRMTETGMSLGTPHYMSPEQAMGEREITARSDVYALGCITYEMLSGDPPFTGSTAQAIVAKVITERAHALATQRHTIPPHVEAAVLTALEKLPADRFATAAEFAAALVDRGYTSASVAATTGVMASRPVDGQRWRRAALALGGSTLALAAVTGVIATRSAPTGPVRRFQIALQQQYSDWLGVAVSHDASKFVYYEPEGSLLLRDAASLTPTPIPGTGNAWMPKFSPDGKSLVINTGDPGAIKVIALEGSAARILVEDSTYSRGTAWGRDNWIYYLRGEDFGRDLMRIRPEGGEPEFLARPDATRGEQLFMFPEPLPDGKRVLLTVHQTDGAMSIGLLEVATGRITPVTPGYAAQLSESGHLVVIEGSGRLKAARIDPTSGTLLGGFSVLAEGLTVEYAGMTPFSISAEGTLVYLPETSGRSVMRVSRDGGRETTVDPSWAGRLSTPALSPDATRIAIALYQGGRQELWIKNLTSGAFTRLAGMGNYNYRPAWSPDGKFVAFTSDQDGPMTTYIVPADGSASPRRLLPSQPTVDEVQFSRDGRWVVFRAGSGGGRDIRAQRTEGDTTSIGIATSRFEEFSPALSPDGKWVAYASDETGRTEVLVRPFPSAGDARYAVSSAGGSEPLWANSGRELFFRDGADNLVAVSVAPGDRFSAGPARVLFSAKPYLTEFRHRMYSVSPDDRSFLFIKRGENAALNHVIVTLNWFEELKSKVK